MFLDNNFDTDTRVLYVDCWECWICGRNGQDRGGLELHHIWGRISSSPLNSALLCHECHSHMGHSREERLGLFRKTLNFLLRIGYKLTKYDDGFLMRIADDLRHFRWNLRSVDN